MAYFSAGGSADAPFHPPGELLTTLFADLNGDGLIDATVVGGNAQQVTLHPYLSTGRGFRDLGAQPAIPASTFGAGATDLNGDGRAELILGKQGSSGYLGVDAFTLMLNSTDDQIIVAQGAGPAPNWGNLKSRGFLNEFDQQLRGWVGDFNGDGITDIVSAASGQYSIANGPADNVMTKAFNGYGAEIDVTYTPSSKWTNDRMPSVEQAVTGITVKDGRGGASTSKYAYTGGKYSFSERRFLGFATETETLPGPCFSFGPEPHPCPTVSRTLSQDFASVGAVKGETWRDANGTTVHHSSRVYAANNTVWPYTSLRTQLLTYRYEQPGAGQNPPYLLTVTNYGHDLYGNVTFEQDYGRYDVAGDERVRYFSRAPNIDKYIVSPVFSEAVYEGLTSASGTLMSQILSYYDQTAVQSTPPEKGDLRRRAVRSTPAGGWANEYFDYDPYGNRTLAKDPANNETTWEWDTPFHLYPIEEKNALNQSKTWTWNFPCGQPATETDLNGIVTNLTYDVFCRKTAEARPATGYQRIFGYLNFGNTAAQHFRTGRQHPNGGWIYAYEYFDGLGRVWRNRTTGPTANDIFVDREFDARGNRASETFPYYAGDAQYSTVFGYDTLDRLVLQINADQTTRSVAHTIDDRDSTGIGESIPLTSTITTDELGRSSTVVSDAYERPIELKRVLSGVGPAIERRSYDRLGRLLGVKDPGGSEWSYTTDFRGLRLTSDDPDLGQNWTYVYDLAGRLTSQTDARGLATTFPYDALNRLKTKTSPRPAGGTDVVTNTYDEDHGISFENIGHLTTAESKLAGVTVATQTFDYDGEGHLVQQQWTVDGTTHTATTGFAPGGEVLWRDYPDGDAVGSAQNPFTYDSVGRLFAVPGIVSSTTYAADGQTNIIAYPNGVSTNFAYDPERHFLTRIKTAKAPRRSSSSIMRAMLSGASRG